MYKSSDIKIGEQNRANNGQLMTIIDISNCSNITIQFEDGTIVTNKTYYHFKQGQISNPNYQRYNASHYEKRYVNKEIIMNNGLKAKIIRCPNSSDIDVLWEDSYISKNITMKQFKNGTLSHPKYNTYSLKNAKNKVGQSKTMHCGMKCTVIAYRHSSDIDVQFEDGVIKEHVSYKSFTNCTILHPNISIGYSARRNRLGLTSVSKNGQKITIIKDDGVNKLTVQFEDGTIRNNIQYYNFKIGAVENPNYKYNHNRKNRQGETSLCNNGQLMRIIEYINSKDFTVEFDDEYKTIVHCKSYTSFKAGEVLNPNFGRSPLKAERIGLENINKYGFHMRIKEYKRSSDITVEFDDGSVTNGVGWREFLKGSVLPPTLSYFGNGTFGNLILQGLIHKDGKRCYYDCTCSKCNKKMILTPELMMKHKC